MKRRYLGLFAAPMLMSQCQPACTPIDTGPAPVELPVNMPAPPVVTTAPTTTPAPAVPTFSLDIHPIDPDDCWAMEFVNDGTGTLDLDIQDIDGRVLEQHLLAPGDDVSVAWYLLQNGIKGMLIDATVVTPGNPNYPVGYVTHDGLIRQDQECDVFNSGLIGSIDDGPGETCVLKVGWTAAGPERFEYAEVVIDIMDAAAGWSKTGIVNDAAGLTDGILVSEHWFTLPENVWSPPAGTALQSLSLRGYFTYIGGEDEFKEVAFAPITVSANECLA